MTKPASTTKKPRKQHTPEFRQEALKLAERIGGGGGRGRRGNYRVFLTAPKVATKTTNSANLL